MDGMKDTSVFLLLHQILHLSKYQAMKRMEALDLKPSQAGILFLLNKHEGISQRELAEKIGITPPSMTVALKKLESREYILRKPDQEDQRIVRIYLKEKGIQCVEDLENILKEMEDLLHHGMSVEERLLFRRLTMQMRDNLFASKDLKGMDLCALMKETRHSGRHGF